MNRICFLIFNFISHFLISQTFEEKFIFSDTKDSLFIKSYYKTFDKEGNYRNGKEIKVYENVIGQIESWNSNYNNVALCTSYKDSIYYYVNGKLVSKINKKEIKYFNNSDVWCALSENGNSIYYIQKDSSFILFVNDIPIDSSKFEYTSLAINNEGFYTFAKGFDPIQNIGKYDYMFFIHSKNKKFDHVRTVRHFFMFENGYYYQDDDYDYGPEYLIINDVFYKNFDKVSNIYILDWDHYFFTCVEKGVKKINVNGMFYEYDYTELSDPTFDKNGNFAFYDKINYYLYKVINGKREEKPITNYGVRPEPIYITPKGSSIHCFKTDDSVYLYRDEKLMNKSSIEQFDYLDLNDYQYSKPKCVNFLTYLEFNKLGYLLYNDTISQPIIPLFKFDQFNHNKRMGEIVHFKLFEKGFFLIQKTGPKSYLVIINNKYYKKIENIDEIVEKNFFFDGKELIFYGLKNLGFYQYKIKL